MTDLYGNQWSNIADTVKDQFLQQYSKTGDINAASEAITGGINSLSETLVGMMESFNNQGVEEVPSVGGAGDSDDSGSSDSGSKTGSPKGGGGKTTWMDKAWKSAQTAAASATATAADAVKTVAKALNVAGVVSAASVKTGAYKPHTPKKLSVTGNALAEGTLMGELGPELYVSGG